MKAIFILLATSLAALANPEPQFQNNSLDGWKREGADAWSLADGVLTGTNDEKKTGSILWSKESFEDFAIEFEFRFSGDIDSGVFLRKENDQIQIGVSRSLKRDMTGSPYIASEGGYPVEAKGVAELLKKGDWNRMRIEARGPEYRVFLGGKEVAVYHSKTAAEKGPVGFQVHPGVEMTIEFRNISIGKLES
ncbi:3-keto-disaccharide hydrolase [Haloferula sargassicola]|uniref:3-keto-alpha-glucoside-1,2-lyase/3-keto-2-hydroxy-glucal hydratase domain-containing protein n=1 Tax=Haloferula sargassicola TaxID=490096 RepID=A0ABP9ULH9_9BACT